MKSERPPFAPTEGIIAILAFTAAFEKSVASVPVPSGPHIFTAK